MKRRKQTDIVNRRSFRGPAGVTQVERELACGHRQLQPSGGKAHVATAAYCLTCYPVPIKPAVEATPP